jgi:hypothetical protein
VIRSRDIICSIYTNYPIQMQVVKSDLLLYTIIIYNNLSYNISTSIYTVFIRVPGQAKTQIESVSTKRRNAGTWNAGTWNAGTWNAGTWNAGTWNAIFYLFMLFINILS